MAVTRSTSVDRATSAPPRSAGIAFRWRPVEFLALLAAGAAVWYGLRLVDAAKSAPLASVDSGLAAKQLLDLNELTAREDLLPALAAIFPQPAEREFAARKIYDVAGSLANVGAIAHLRVTDDELSNERGLASLKTRLGARTSMPLLSGEDLRTLKPLLVVRHPAVFHSAFQRWTWIFLAGFLVAHLVWSIRGRAGDPWILPAVLLLSGIGLILMISLRDPVRDTLLFVDFAQGAFAGCIVMAVAAELDYERLFGSLTFVPLLASFALSALLIVFGTGPGTSDAKVNLFGFQPVELIRVLLIFFLAGYFAPRWDVLRHGRETRAALAPLTRRFDIPPLEYTLPAAVCVALSLIFFFLQKDMGPALVFACLFLVLYGMARGSVFVPVVGLSLVVAGFLFGYYMGVPHTVGERVSMWISPWNNMVHGGDQLADSLWAFATGGARGAGIGRGDPQLVPAAHTDLILSALGEEWGFAGIAAVFALYALFIWRALSIARRARRDYEFFLAAGIAAATALQIFLIAGGALGVLPLSGVVTPFLSYGRTALITNFLIAGILIGISTRTGEESPRFRAPIRLTAILFALAGGVILAKAAYIQLFRSAAVMGEGTLVVQADGARRYQYNPRFQDVVRLIPMGTIYDRNGLPLATSDWNELEKHRAEYRELGIDIDQVCPRSEHRHYPLGGATFDLLGDLRTRLRWAASNTSFVERDSSRRLRGYDDRPTLVEAVNPKTKKIERVVRYDYRELVPLLRHRDEPENPEVRRILDRTRDVHLSIDARLQMRVSEILKKQLADASQDKGAAVAMDPATGDLLAAVSYPLPVLGTAPDDAAAPEPAANPYLDRVRYGLYPPGSTFKVVTAMAALRKDPELIHRTYECIRLPDGRVGNYIKGSKRPIRDDVQDKAPHGSEDMEHAVIVSCNAYFAQLGTYDVGAKALLDTGNLLGISTASPNTEAQLKKSLPQSSYGQGQVVVSPFQMARVAATIANGGAMPQGRWIADETNTRTLAAQTVLPAGAAATLAKFMREVVTSGTGRRAATAAVPMAGKTGTAELADAPSHAWFIGFAPYSGNGRKIAVSVLIENGVYGGTAAAPAAAEIVNAAAKLGLIQP